MAFDRIVMPPMPQVQYDPVGPIRDLAQIQQYQVEQQQAQQQAAAQQRMQQLAQQYGSDTDGFVAQLTKEYPAVGLKMGEQLATMRKAAAQQHFEQVKADQQDLGVGVQLLQAAKTDPALYPTVKTWITARAPQLGQRLPDQYDPAAVDGWLQTGQSTSTFLKAQADAAQWLVKGDTQKGIATLFASADTPQKWQMAQQLAGQAGASGLAAMYGDQFSPENQQKAQDAIAKVSPEKGGQHVEGMYKGRRTFGVFDPNTNTYTVDGQQVSASEFTPIPPASIILRQMGGGAASGPGGTGALTPEGVDYAATQYRLTGKMPPMGMGNSPARAAIINAAAQQAKILQQSPAASIQRQAAYAGNAKAMQRIQTLSASAEAFEEKALAQADIVDSISDKVPRSMSPLLNKALLSGQKELLGDTNTQLLYNAIQTFTTEYAKIMTGSTNAAEASTDAARREAANLVSASLSKGTLKATTALMRREMALTMQGYDATLNHINERMAGVSQVPGEMPAAPSGAGAKPDPLGIR